MTIDKSKINRFKYDAKISHYYRILITNIILSIITLGIYSFWGKVRFRKYSASRFILLGKRFEHTGTGGELLKGFLKALLILVILYLFLGILISTISVVFNVNLQNIVSIIIIPIYIFLIFIVIYSATRYRYSRTSWQGIRARLDGSAKQYAVLSINRMFLNIISLGYLIPYSDFKITGYVINNSYFGNAKANLVSKPDSLVRINVITLLLAIPTLGFSRLWYMAAFAKCAFSNIHIASVKFGCKYSGPKLLKLTLGNLLILIFTLGIGFPFIIWRNLNFFAQNVAIMGDIDISKITQSKQNGEAIGEGGNDLDTILGVIT